LQTAAWLEQKFLGCSYSSQLVRSRIASMLALATVQTGVFKDHLLKAKKQLAAALVT